MDIKDIERELEELKKEYLLAVITGDQKLVMYYEARIHNTESFIKHFKKGEEEYK